MPLLSLTQDAKLLKSLYNLTFPSIFVQNLYQILAMKFAIIKERKNPPDRRVVFSPEKLAEARARFPEAEFVVESSDIRVFSDECSVLKIGFLNVKLRSMSRICCFK